MKRVVVLGALAAAIGFAGLAFALWPQSDRAEPQPRDRTTILATTTTYIVGRGSPQRCGYAPYRSCFTALTVDDR